MAIDLPVPFTVSLSWWSGPAKSASHGETKITHCPPLTKDASNHQNQIKASYSKGLQEIASLESLLIWFRSVGMKRLLNSFSFSEQHCTKAVEDSLFWPKFMPQPAGKGDAFVHKGRSRKGGKGRAYWTAGIVIPDTSNGTDQELLSIPGKAFFPGRIISKEVQVFRECKQVFLSFLFELWTPMNNLFSYCWSITECRVGR